MVDVKRENREDMKRLLRGEWIGPKRAKHAWEDVEDGFRISAPTFTRDIQVDDVFRMFDQDEKWARWQVERLGAELQYRVREGANGYERYLDIRLTENNPFLDVGAKVLDQRTVLVFWDLVSRVAALSPAGGITPIPKWKVTRNVPVLRGLHESACEASLKVDPRVRVFLEEGR